MFCRVCFRHAQTNKTLPLQNSTNSNNCDVTALRARVCTAGRTRMRALYACQTDNCHSPTGVVCINIVISPACPSRLLTQQLSPSILSNTCLGPTCPNTANWGRNVFFQRRINAQGGRAKTNFKCSELLDPYGPRPFDQSQSI